LKNFDRLFNPRAIAVLGASQDLASISGQPVAHLKAKGYAGKVYPVNPRYAEVAGYRCYPDLAALPETPDVVVVAVAARRVPEALGQIADRGAPFALILSSGFAEAGDEGRRAQLDLAEIARARGVHVIGPNCQGYMNIADGIHVGFGAPYGLAYRKGAVSLTSQSGAFGNSILMLADAEGLGFRRYVSTGNESVTTTLDLFEYLLEDPGTALIAGYVEGFQDARRLLGIGQRALRAGKPILVWKVGNSEAGAKAAASHTANLGGATALYRAAFRQTGIVEVSDVGDMADCAKALLPGRLPRGNRIAIVTISGGAGIAMADRATEGGLALPELKAGTIAALRKVLPGYAAVANPLDVTGSLLNDPGMLKATLDCLANDPGVDMIGMALAAASGKLATELAREVVRIARERQVPVLVAWNADAASTGEAYRILDEAGIPRYQSPVRCARGAAALWQYASARQRRRELDGEAVAAISRPAARQALAGRRADLTEYESKGVLADYGIAVTRERLATDRDAAAALAAEIGFPVALKIQSPGIPHKTEAGGVRIGVADAAAAARAFDEIVASARRHAPQAQIDGVLVQEMVAGGTEVILGVNNDPLFGPAVMAGFGGIFAEVLRDVSFRLAPVALSEAHAMLRELRAFPILDGARGRPKADVEALAQAIVRLSALAVDLGDALAELDINPLFVLPAGRGVRAGDALIRPARSQTP
jgi:acyl-CoA synthetase (NDP forming)